MMICEKYDIFQINSCWPKGSKRVYMVFFGILNFRNDLFYQVKDKYWIAWLSISISLKT